MYSAKKDGRRYGLHNLHPPCTLPRLEVRNAELYEYWCPNAKKWRKPLVSATFFFCFFKIVPIREGAKSPDPNPDPKAKTCGNVRKAVKGPASLTMQIPPLPRSPFLCFLRRVSCATTRFFAAIKLTPEKWGASFIVKPMCSSSYVHLRWNIRSPTSCLSQS